MNKLTKNQLIECASGRLEAMKSALETDLSPFEHSAMCVSIQLTEIALISLTAPPDLQECQKFDQAKLINKFYERYPLDTFKSDSERAAALGYYMAGAELQRCGEFIVYEDVYHDE